MTRTEADVPLDTLAVLFVQSVLLVGIAAVLLVGTSQNALWWGPESVTVLQVAGWTVGLKDLFVVLVLIQLGLGGSYIVRWAWEEGPFDAAAEVVRLRRELAQIQDERDQARAEAEEWEERYRTAQREREAALGHVPDEILEYYADAPDAGEELEELRRRAEREVQAWESMAGTFSTDAVAPLLDAIRAVPEDHAAGHHHHTSREVLDRLIQVSQELKDDDWFAKAIRWMAKKYGTRPR